MDEFLSPNWHPILNHFPLGLLSIGVLLELLSLFIRRGGMRTAARWMILCGTLLAIPTVTAGLYAFRETLLPATARITLMPWHALAEASPWTADQWRYAWWHLGLNGGAALLFVTVSMTFIALSDRWRKLLYAPLLLLLLAAMGLVVVGSWFGGEMVYRFGVAAAPEDAAAPAGWGDIRFYLPPLQTHLFAAGLVLASAVLAVALAFRQWTSPVVSERAPRPVAGPTTRAYAAWAWLVAGLLALGAGIAGAWAVMGSFTADAFQQNLDTLAQTGEHLRLLLHLIFGFLLIVLPLVLAGLLRFVRRSRIIPTLLMGLIVLIAGFQVWLGIAMLFDGHARPVLGFSSPAAAATGHTHSQSEQADAHPEEEPDHAEPDSEPPAPEAQPTDEAPAEPESTPEDQREPQPADEDEAPAQPGDGQEDGPA